MGRPRASARHCAAGKARRSASIALSRTACFGAFPAMTQPDEQPELSKEMQAKAQRAQMILYGVMIFFLILPFVLLWLFKK